MLVVNIIRYRPEVIAVKDIYFSTKHKIMTKHGLIYSTRAASYVGHLQKKVFGEMDCAAAKNLVVKSNRVYFHTVKDAIEAGYRPCKDCHPVNLTDFLVYKKFIDYDTLEEFQVDC